MKKIIYLDHAATTPVRDEVMAEMLPYFNEIFGNPSSIHSKGVEAAQAIEHARQRIAKILNCEPTEIIFTSGGTESVNLAIKGVALANKDKGKHIITQKTEHNAVLKACKWLEHQGFEVTYLNVDKHGLVSPEDLQKNIKTNTILVSIMYANNEIGTIQPIKELARICKSKGVFFHTDACQAAGYLDIDVKNLGIDLMSLNGSKIYGPKGIGLLFVKKGLMLEPLIHGGGQEHGLRAGTENVPAIIGLAKALELAQKEKEKECKRLANLRDYLIKQVLEKIPNAKLNGHPSQRLPNNIHFSFMGIEGEALLYLLDKEGICASTGSACSSKSLEESHVLKAIGLPIEYSHGSVRFSLGKSTTKEDIDFLLEILSKSVAKLRQFSPFNEQSKNG
ncbi:MAG: cysteine desulfurase NifS [Candidatus Nanoarchaeia archaeon]